MGLTHARTKTDGAPPRVAMDSLVACAEGLAVALGLVCVGLGLISLDLLPDKLTTVLVWAAAGLAGAFIGVVLMLGRRVRRIPGQVAELARAARGLPRGVAPTQPSSTREFEPLWRELAETARVQAQRSEDQVQEVRALEAQLAVLEEHRGALQTANATALADADARMTFLAQMSHEVRTPLNGVIGMAELAMELDASPLMLEHLETIRASGRGLANIVNDILGFSKIEAGHVDIAHEPFSLELLLAETLPSIGVLAEQKGIRFSAEVNVDVPRLLIGDSMRLRQILLNLLANAIKFTEEGSVHLWAEVCMVERVSWLRLCVTDTGIGMTPQQLVDIFEPFNQAETGATRRFGGAGLGLSISRRLAELLKGRLEVQSTPGEGSTFSLSVPIPRWESRISRLSKAGRVLVVDKHPDAAELLRKKLVRVGAKVEVTARLPATVDPRVTRVFADIATLDYCPGWQDKLRSFDADGALILIQRSVLPTPRPTMGRFMRAPLFGDRLESLLLSAEMEVPVELETESETQPIRHLKILVAEDNPVNQMLLRRLLDKLGHEVVIAKNGEEALEAATRDPVDLVLMDIEMPVMDGIEAARCIRETPRGRQLPIWAVTAHATDTYRKRCFEVGMNKWLTKPIDRNELERSLAELGAPAEEPVCVSDDVTLSTLDLDTKDLGLPPLEAPTATMDLAV